MTWGDYVKSSEKYTGKDEKEHSRAIYTRQPMEETVRVQFKDFTRTKDYQLVCDSNVHVHVSRIPLKGGYSLVTAYVINKRKNPANSAEAIMFQVEIKAYAEDGSASFIAEHICREILASDEFYFEQRPIMGRGRGCAAVWDNPVDGRTTYVKSAFIPEYEFPGVSAALDGFDRCFFSTFTMSVKSKKEETIGKLNTLADSYEKWINSTLLGNARMSNPDFKDKIGNKVIDRCQDALKRIREGISIIENDDTSFEAFCFMNRVIFLQNSIKGYAKKHGTGTECNFQDLLRVYAIILQAAYTYSLQDEYKDVIDPYYSLVGYFNSIRELGGAVRLLQDDIPKRIYRIKNKYGLDKQRYLNHNVEITSRMSSYKIPEKLNQLETTCDSKECLDTAIATNMIAVGMDVDRLGLMVVTGQPKQNSEYIQATSRIGRAFPGLVVTLYNAYRPRDLSHYENFTGYHSQLYRFVEGTTATPFSARARDRVLHALVISAIRLNFPNMANNPDAAAIGALTADQIDSVKNLILDRLNIIKPSARADAEEEIDRFIDWWKLQAAQTKPLRYYVVGTERYNRLMNPYDQPHNDNEKATLRSMREVESSANMFYYTEE